MQGSCCILFRPRVPVTILVRVCLLVLADGLFVASVLCCTLVSVPSPSLLQRHTIDVGRVPMPMISLADSA